MGLVVGAAVVRHGRVLAARRTRPPESAGRWELPGGKVESGETPAEALVRELDEELGLAATVIAWLAGEQPVAGGRHRLRVARVEAVGEPRLLDHDAVRWLGPAELGEVDWLEPDRPFLPELRAHLLGGGRIGQDRPVQARGIFFDEDHARAVARQLLSDGYAAAVARERFAGEDDDEDHPWAVTTDAPEVVLELLVDRHDGWLDAPVPDQPVRPGVAPLELPDAPRRLKRPPL